MRITTNRNFMNRTGTVKTENLSQTDGSTKKSIKNFDEITIRSKEIFDEQKFARQLSQKILKEISAPTDDYKIEEIKTQVQLNDYPIMIDEIAKKMLLS